MDESLIRDKPVARRSCRESIRLLARDQRGATAVEYGLILTLIVLAMIGALAGVGNVTSGMWNNVNAKVTNAQ